MPPLTTPKPFQRAGVDMIHAFGGRALLGDDLGLGKTYQALTYLDEIGEAPRLVICPAYLRLHWQREAWQHFRLRTELLLGKSPYDTERVRWEAAQGTLLVIGYDVLGGWAPFLQSLNLRAVVSDEVHLVGNPAAARTRHWSSVVRGVPRLLCLSATPLRNKHWELFPILSTLCPWVPEFASPFSFGFQFCCPEKSFGRWTFPGARGGKELHRLMVENCLIRRTKEEVAPDLPPRQVVVVPLDIDGRGEYEEAERDLIGWLAKTDVAAARRAARAERYVRFTYLKRLAARKKFPRVLSWLDDFAAGTAGKVLVGAVHLDRIELMRGRYPDSCVTITGGMDDRRRAEAEARVRQDPKCRFLFGQIKACGLGLNLPELNTTATTELLFTPADHKQFDGRSHRLTSTLPVTSYYFVAAGTIEELLCEIIQRKQGMMDRALDGEDVRDDSLLILDELQARMAREGGRGGARCRRR